MTDTIVQGGFHNKSARSQPPALELSGINKWFGAEPRQQGCFPDRPPGQHPWRDRRERRRKIDDHEHRLRYLRADSGDRAVNGKPTDIRTPRDAIAAGIGMVHQHFMLVDTFTVVENVVLGAEGGALSRPALPVPARSWSGWSVNTRWR